MRYFLKESYLQTKIETNKMKTILLLLTTLFLTSSAFAQGSLQDQMTEFVMGKYPESEEVEWAEAGKQFTGSFYDGRELKVALFDESGNWVQTETNIEVGSLDADIKGSINKEYPGAEVHRVQHIEVGSYYYYLVDVTADDAGQQLKIDAVGSILSVTPMTFIDEGESDLD